MGSKFYFIDFRKNTRKYANDFMIKLAVSTYLKTPPRMVSMGRVATGQGKVMEIQGQGKVREF